MKRPSRQQAALSCRTPAASLASANVLDIGRSAASFDRGPSAQCASALKTLSKDDTSADIEIRERAYLFGSAATGVPSETD